VLSNEAVKIKIVTILFLQLNMKIFGLVACLSAAIKFSFCV